jgi:hypothetical protein
LGPATKYTACMRSTDVSGILFAAWITVIVLAAVFAPPKVIAQGDSYRLADEYKLVDKLIRADREVELARLRKDDTGLLKANGKSEAAGAALTAFCESYKKKVGIKAYGIVGCLPEHVPWVPKKK